MFDVVPSLFAIKIFRFLTAHMQSVKNSRIVVKSLGNILKS